MRRLRYTSSRKLYTALNKHRELGLAELKHTSETRALIVSLYVDDLIYTGNDEAMLKEFKQSMIEEFEMSDLGRMHYFLGLEVMQLDSGIFISQKRYAKEVLKKFGMDKSKLVLNPNVLEVKIDKNDTGVTVDGSMFKQLVGSLIYLTTTRPDLMYAVSVVSRYMEKPTEMHLMKAKRILRKNTSGYAFILSNAVVAWSSRK
ncbi:uncharacterized mitochondrial protein AtMg00810-like [Vicia villosa]|uniref:uncharacterized mitochondrial protein AtMg00810-like n=1 Tax=Vicia villosa TaxID=3911 RepID=UPI00273BC765|nr:uncharacterized mitochondrial protein AtMg00810-like [Vicia villosa]